MKAVVSGLINIETTLKVDSFPIQYTPVRYPFYGVDSTVSGVGFNVAMALHTLGDRVTLFSLTGDGFSGKLVQETLLQAGLDADAVLPMLPSTAQSVILYDPSGRRMIHTDLKDIQEQVYPAEKFTAAVQACDVAVLCNVNFSRPLLALAKAAGVMVATDVHTISSLDDPYNMDFMAAAGILFMSDEALPEAPERWIRRVAEHFGNRIVVIGLGAAGALLYTQEDGQVRHVPAVQPREVVSTIGAGDALFSSFLHFYFELEDAPAALARAAAFAGYKVGTTGAAQGFLGPEEFKRIYREIKAERGL